MNLLTVSKEVRVSILHGSAKNFGLPYACFLGTDGVREEFQSSHKPGTVAVCVHHCGV